MNKSFNNLIQYSHLGLVMFFIMILGWYAGTKIDGYFGTAPTGETVGFFVGLAGGFIFVMNEIYRLRKELESGENSEDNGDLSE